MYSDDSEQYLCAWADALSYKNLDSYRHRKPISLMFPRAYRYEVECIFSVFYHSNLDKLNAKCTACDYNYSGHFIRIARGLRLLNEG